MAVTDAVGNVKCRPLAAVITASSLGMTVSGCSKVLCAYMSAFASVLASAEIGFAPRRTICASRPADASALTTVRVLSGDKRVAFIPELDTLTGLFADFGELLGSVLDAKAPIDGGHAPGKVRHAPVGTAAITAGRCTGKRADIVGTYLRVCRGLLAGPPLWRSGGEGWGRDLQLGSGYQSHCLQLLFVTMRPGVVVVIRTVGKSGSYLRLSQEFHREFKTFAAQHSAIAGS
jgi:hypothetical protein